MGLAVNLHSYVKNQHYGSYVISWSPLLITSYWHDFRINFSRIISLLPPDKEVWYIFQIGYYKSEEAAKEIKAELDEFRKERSNIHYWFLNNTEEENSRFKRLGMKSRFINQNAFLDENRYRIMSTRKKYDAIYLARFTPVKRHYLARKIKKLLLIGSYKPEEVEYYEESRAILKHADYREKVWGKEVTGYMNQAQTGLCLSDLEGAMFVSSEYLLSGVPVVSTESLGGRDIYYSEENSIMVEANEDSIAEAVYKLIRQPLKRSRIREYTLSIMEEHRARFKGLVQMIYEEQKCSRDFYSEWADVFIHKMGLRTRIPYTKFVTRILRDGYSFKIGSA